MELNNNNLYENYILNNTSKKISKTQPYQYFQSLPSQNKYNKTNNQFQNINPNFSSGNQTTYKNTMKPTKIVLTLYKKNLIFLTEYLKDMIKNNNLELIKNFKL